MKIRFSEDKFYDKKLKYKANVVYDIPVEGNEAARWLKRGGVEVIEVPVEEVSVEEVAEVLESVEVPAEEVSVGEVAAVEEVIVNEVPKKENKRGKSKGK